MAWLFQGVLNAGLQILLSIFGGWLCARLRLVDPEVMSRNVNAFAMKAAYPAFIIHLLGVKTNLRDAEAWRALGVFVLWVVIIHSACFIVHKMRGKRSNVLQLGLNCLLLTTNNTGCIGWPVLIATVGQQSAVLSMLLGVLFFIQLLPVSICCFEYHKWQQQAGEQLTDATALSSEVDDVHGDQLPVCQGDQDKHLALPAPPTAFPHEFRYCYWSNELYQPHKPTSYTPVHTHDDSGSGVELSAAAAGFVEVCVESADGSGDDALDHHCFGGSSVRAGSRVSDSNSCSSQCHDAHAGSSTTHGAPGHEWWRSGRPKPQGGLKRAKDSFDSLYTPFAAAAVAAKQQELEQPQRPSTLGLSSLTRRLSRGLSAAGAVAAAAATAAAAVATPAAGLVKAASLHTASSLRRAGSLKPAASLRKPTAGRDGQMSTPLMAEHADVASSCCPSHRTASPPFSPKAGLLVDVVSADSAAPAAAARVGGPSACGSDSGEASIVDHSSSSSSSRAAGCSVDGKLAPARGAAVAGGAPAAGRLSRMPGLMGQQVGNDSAVELHCMCNTLADGDNWLQHLRQQDTTVVPAGVRKKPAVEAVAVELPSSSSSGALHTLCHDDMCGRLNSDTGRVSSRTNLLLPSSGGSSGVTKGASKLGRCAPVGPNNTGIGSKGGLRPSRVQKKGPAQNIFSRFVSRHPLLCHIVAGQLQSFHLWLNVVAIALSVSGARKYLDPQSPEAIPALGFVDGVLSWFSSACIPTLLFANGVWICGKDVLCGGWRGQMKVMFLLLLKLTLLPALMIGLTMCCNIRGEYGLSLVLLASCPLAPLAFLVCQQYGFGAELATSITIQGVLLMLPQMMAIIKVNQIGGLYDVALLGT